MVGQGGEGRVWGKGEGRGRAGSGGRQAVGVGEGWWGEGGSRQQRVVARACVKTEGMAGMPGRHGMPCSYARVTHA